MGNVFKTIIVAYPAELDKFLNSNLAAYPEDDPRIIGYAVTPTGQIIVTIKHQRNNY